MYLILLLLACCSWLFATQTFASNHNTTEKVSIHLRWYHQFQFAGYYAAIEKGYYANEGLDVELQAIKLGTGMITPVTDGTADYGVADGSLLAARSLGDPVVLLAQIFQHSPQIFLSLRETGIYTPNDLRGKKVMFAENNVSQNLLFSNTLGYKKSFEIVPQSYDLEDLINGKTDLFSAYLTNEPYQLRKRGIAFNILHPRSFGIDYFGDNLFTSEAEIRTNPQRVQKVIRATLKGWQYALKNKNEIIDLIINKYDPQADRDKLLYESQVTEQMILPDLISLGEIDMLRYKEIARAYARLGVIDSPEIPPGFIYQPPPKALVQLSEAERKWLSEHPEITLGTGKNFEPLIIVADDGTITGIEANIIQRINEITGTNIRIVVGEWANVVEKAKEKEIDGLLVSTVQEKRAPYFLFTNSLINSYKYIFSTNFKFTSLENLKGKRVGYQRGILIHKNFLKKQPGVIPVPLESSDTLASQLQRNQIDAVLGGNIFKYYLQEHMFVEGYSAHIVPDSKIKVVYSIRKDWPELHSIVNKALAKISPGEIADIQQEWLFPEEPESTDQISLSQKEHAWLRDKHTVQVRVLDIPPFILSKEGTAPEGMTIDYLKLLAQRTGIHFDYRPSNKPFSEALDGVKKHQGPDIIPVIVSSPERAQSILFTNNYITSPMMIFIRSGDKQLITKIDDLAGQKIAILKGSMQHKMVKKDYPDLDLVLFGTDRQAMEAVATEQADAYIGILTMTAYHILHRGLYNLKLAAPTPFDEYAISMGIRNDWPELASIIDKGLASITEEEHTKIRNKYFSLQYEPSSTAQYMKWFLVAAGGALGVIILFFIWNRILAKQVATRTVELKESEKKYRRVLESTSTVPWERDLKSGVFTFMGKQVEQMLGYPADSWSDFTVWVKRLHPEDRHETVQFCEAEIEQGQDHDFTYRVLHKDGSYRWIRDIVSLIQGNNDPKKIVGFMHDITEQKELALEKQQLEKQWKQTQKLEAVGTLAGGIAHDFNNILSAILGFAELAKDGVEVDSEIADDLNEVLHAAHRAKELVQQILAFSRQSQIEPTPLEPQLIIKEGLKMLRSSLPTTIEISENIAQNCGMVKAAPTQIHQILMNLCTNAFHAMEKNGGTMTVEMKQAKYLPPELQDSPGDYIELSVGDTGEGIENAIVDKIFDPFFTTKEQGKGTGMGLSIIYGIIKEYGGSITVKSAQDKGTTFHVYLPRCEEVTPHVENSDTNIPGGDESILFIDDEHGIAKAGKAMLEHLGYDVTIKTESFEALKTFQKQPNAFDLIITDQTMPGMTGFDLAKKILKIRTDIPIILCTGYSSIVNEDVAKSQGIKEFTTKPLSKNVISKLIRKVLDNP